MAYWNDISADWVPEVYRQAIGTNPAQFISRASQQGVDYYTFFGDDSASKNDPDLEGARDPNYPDFLGNGWYQTVHYGPDSPVFGQLADLSNPSYYPCLKYIGPPPLVPVQAIRFVVPVNPAITGQNAFYRSLYNGYGIAPGGATDFVASKCLLNGDGTLGDCGLEVLDASLNPVETEAQIAVWHRLTYNANYPYPSVQSPGFNMDSLHILAAIGFKSDPQYSDTSQDYIQFMMGIHAIEIHLATDSNFWTDLKGCAET